MRQGQVQDTELTAPEGQPEPAAHRSEASSPPRNPRRIERRYPTSEVRHRSARRPGPGYTGGVVPPRSEATTPSMQHSPVFMRRKTRLTKAQTVLQVVLINPNYAALWLGQAISSIGDFAWDTALVLWIATFIARGHSWSPLAVSGVVLAAAIPEVLVGPLAGVFVDRWNNRRTIIIMSTLQAIIALLLVVASGFVPLPVIGHPRLTPLELLGVIYTDVVLLTACAQFASPARFALIKHIIPGPKQDQAVETLEGVQGLSVIIGPPLAAALVFGVGVEWALLVNVFSFVIALVSAFAISVPARLANIAGENHGSFWSEFRAGLKYVTGHVVLRTILVAEVLTWLGFGSMETLGYFFITENLHAPASDYGLLGADFGIGAIVGALLVTFFGERIGLARLFWVALASSGIFVIVMSHLTSLFPALVAAFFFGISTTSIIVSASPLALDATSQEFVGRVMAVINPIGRLAALVSVLTAGVLVSTVLRGMNVNLIGLHFGPVDTVLTGMGALALAGGLYTRAHLQRLIGEQSKAKAAESAPEASLESPARP